VTLRPRCLLPIAIGSSSLRSSNRRPQFYGRANP